MEESEEGGEDEKESDDDWVSGTGKRRRRRSIGRRMKSPPRMTGFSVPDSGWCDLQGQTSYAPMRIGRDADGLRFSMITMVEWVWPWALSRGEQYPRQAPCCGEW